MELYSLALQAAKIALWAVDKVSGGALEKVGADVLELLTKRFQGKLQVKETETALLEAAILSEVELDEEFRKSLEKLVNQYYQVQNNSVSQKSVSQKTESGVNIDIEENSGTVIGQQIGQQFFR